MQGLRERLYRLGQQIGEVGEMYDFATRKRKRGGEGDFGEEDDVRSAVKRLLR